MHVELAHITDPHLPLAGVRLAELPGKRIIGWLSWTLRRRRAHRPEALRAVMADVRQRLSPEGMLLLTGDVVNISSRAEFAAARQWLEREAGAPRKVMFVPGNHDFYVADAARAGLMELVPWMSGRAEDVAPADALPEFPVLRRLGNVALIGLNSAYAAPWREASGRLGEAQLQRLEEMLRDTAAKGFCRVVMVHHPPLVELGASKPRKALKDAAALEEVLTRAGAELVLFGHTHRWAHVRRETASGGVMHVLSAPSASMITGHKAPPAGWQHIVLARREGAWHMRVERRELREGGMSTRERLALSSAA